MTWHSCMCGATDCPLCHPEGDPDLDQELFERSLRISSYRCQLGVDVAQPCPHCHTLSEIGDTLWESIYDAHFCSIDCAVAHARQTMDGEALIEITEEPTNQEELPCHYS